MKESPKRNPLDGVWIVLFYLGMIGVPFLLISPFTKLSLKSQFVLALLSSFCWITSSFLFTRIPNKLEKSKSYHLRLLGAGIVQAVLAILFRTLLKPRTEIAYWAAFLNLALGLIGFLIFYIAVIFYIFPELAKKIPKGYKVNNSDEPEQEKSIRDPLSGLPKSLQKLINEGNDAIAKTTINVVAIGASAVMVSVFFLGSTKFPLAVLGVETLTVIIILIIARYFSTYKWQKRAIQSGIPEKKLRSAMKLAGLPWVNIKKE